MAGKRGKRGDDAQIELNLVPIMALLCVLIPVLLAAFNFFEIKVQAMSVPRLASGKAKSKNTKKQKPLSLLVTVKSDHMIVDVNKENRPGVGLKGPKKFPKKQFTVGGDSASRYGSDKRQITEHDYPGLHQQLVAIKNAAAKMGFKKENRTIKITAESTIPWRTIARVIDAARVRLEKDAFGGDSDALEVYSQTKPMKQDRVDKNNPDAEPVKEDKPLFDAVIFAALGTN